MKNYDVVIVGACTAGTYFAHLLAKEGLKVLVVDKDSEQNLCKRLDIFHFTRDSYDQFDIPVSGEGDAEWVHDFDLCLSKSALDNHPKKSHTKVAVMHLPLFIKRLRERAISAGVEFHFAESFVDVVYNDQKQVCGITTTKGYYDTRLVVDASGIPSVVRRKIEDDYIESFEITPRDKFYVLLKYVQLNNPDDKVELSTSWPYYKGWIAPQHNKSGAIIGVGANISYDYAYKCMDKFEKAIKLPEYTLQYEEKGCTPYCRPPLSFVTDGFMVIGDAACLTKPWNGEGIPSAWVQCTPAAKVVAKALSGGKIATKEDLWDINVLYQRGEGAEYAGTRAMLIGAVNMSAKDNDYLFANDIVFCDDDKGPNPNVVGTLLKGVFSGKFSISGLISLMSASNKGEKLKKHYQKYPESPAGYHKWAKTALRLWKKVGTMADTVKDA